MIRYALPLIAAAALAAPAVAAEIQIAANGPVVELTVSETVGADPDLAELSAGVTTIAPSAVEAMRQNATQMTRVVERIEALGVDEDDIQTSGITLNPQYDWDQATNTQRFRGYQVMNRVNITLRDIQRTGEVLDALVEAGATDLGGINWSIDDRTLAQRQARETAFATARQQALDYARMAGYSDLRLLEVDENVMPGGPMPYAIIATGATRDVQESTPVRPGQVQSVVTVTTKYEMVR